MKRKNDGLNNWQRHRLKDLEQYRKRKREYAKTPAQKEKRREYRRKWYQEGGGESQGHKKKQPPEIVFYEKFKEDDDGCWVWQGALNIDGYGTFRGKGAHRWAYEFLIGKIPVGLVIDHLCRNRACVNPSHLDVVTNAENIKRGDYSRVNKNRLGLMHAVKTHCKNGHLYEGDNLRIERRSDGGVARRCKECDRIKTKKYLQNKKRA